MVAKNNRSVSADFYIYPSDLQESERGANT